MASALALLACGQNRLIVIAGDSPACVSEEFEHAGNAQRKPEAENHALERFSSNAAPPRPPWNANLQAWPGADPAERPRTLIRLTPDVRHVIS